MQDVQCYKCSKAFEMKLLEKAHRKDIVETYFNCPHCEKYTTHVTDSWARQEQKEIGKLYEQYIKRKGKLQLKMEQLKEIASE